MKVHQPDGTYRHVKRPKFPLIAAIDVSPDKRYLARANAWSSWHLVQVQCTHEPGWLRGRVNIRGFFTNGFRDYCAYATVESVVDVLHFDLVVTRHAFEEPWMFGEHGGALLAEVPSGYIASKLDTLQAEADKHTAERRRIEKKIELLGELS